MMVFFPLFLCYTFLSFSTSSIAIDTLTPNQALRDNGQTLVSIGESFELGFFSPWTSSHRFIGIWFKNVSPQTVVWVANKDSPLSDSSGVFTITATGNLLIFNNRSAVPIWSSNSSTTSYNPVLQLLNSGNLVVKDIRSSTYLWQSFDHPCDTILPGMKLGWNLLTNQNWYMTSWKSLQDPSSGDFTYSVDVHGLSQLVLRKGLEILYRSGPWDGVRFGGGPPLQENPVFNPIFVHNSSFVYYSFENNEKTTISRFVLNQSSFIEHLTWNPRRGEWVVIFIFPTDQCDIYEQCGPNGVCNANNSLLCKCPEGFITKVPQDWDRLDWSSGCVRKTPLNCTADEGFRKFSRMKLPYTSTVLTNMTEMTLFECEEACSRNCSCTAYAKTEVSGCIFWFGDLIDIRDYSEGGQDLFIKMAAADLGMNNDKRTGVIISVLAASSVLLLVAVICYIIWKRNSKRRTDEPLSRRIQDDNPNADEEDMDQLPLFDLDTIVSATDSFAFQNKIGEGGFGVVYKGELPTGRVIAVKRLSKDSGQGLKEFKNEVIFISKLQHRNLVRLLGCCIHREERMLVYEYMSKRGLDLYLYNQTRGTALDWLKRFNIIVGIARGLLYLHRDSSLRLIHRDLKASNILLDDEMNPKISDFGLARTFGGDRNEESTKRVVGTYGYMSPEYAIDGLFSVKSDVFSYGVLILEIVIGKRNRGFYHPGHDLNLLGHAWRLWNEGRPIELMDALMEKPEDTSELLRCIHVGLLCVQHRPEDRPTMPSVVLMLDSENPTLPEPKHPGFYTERYSTETDSSSTGTFRNTYTTLNDVTITTLHGR